MKGDNFSCSEDFNKRAKLTQPNSAPRFSSQQIVRNGARTRSNTGKSPSAGMVRLFCKDYFKEFCTNSLCEKLHPPEFLWWKSEKGCRFGEKCFNARRQVDEQGSKRSQNNGENYETIGLRVEPPKSSSMFRKKSDIWKPIRFVQYTKAIARHTKFETKILRLE